MVLVQIFHTDRTSKLHWLCTKNTVEQITYLFFKTNPAIKLHYDIPYNHSQLSQFRLTNVLLVTTAKRKPSGTDKRWKDA